MRIAKSIWREDRSKSDFEIVLSLEVLTHLNKFRQNYFFKKEAGGQLFGQLDGKTFLVNIATGPRKSDIRSRTQYLPDRNEEQAEIKEYLKNGIFYLGDWHTHPEKKPVPSEIDIETTNDCFQKSTHGMPGFAFIIVGKTTLVRDWYVGVTAKTGTRRLNLV